MRWARGFKSGAKTSSKPRPRHICRCWRKNPSACAPTFKILGFSMRLDVVQSFVAGSIVNHASQKPTRSKPWLLWRRCSVCGRIARWCRRVKRGSGVLAAMLDSSGAAIRGDVSNCIADAQGVLTGSGGSECAATNSARITRGTDFERPNRLWLLKLDRKLADYAIP
jgi:hypothetical protein